MEDKQQKQKQNSKLGRRPGRSSDFLISFFLTYFPPSIGDPSGAGQGDRCLRLLIRGGRANERGTE